MTESRTAAVVLFLGLALAGTAGPARAQYYLPGMSGAPTAENIQGITVAGKGSVVAKPNLFEIDLELAASSELTADAIVKYRDGRRRLRDAFTGLKLANVAVDERGLLVDQKGMMNPYNFNQFQPGMRQKTEVQLSRKLVVRASNVRAMDEDGVLQLVSKLLDTAQDAGAQVGARVQYNPYYYNPEAQLNTALVRFVVDDFDKLQEAAYEQAIVDARARAQRLARLSGVTLGPVVAVREVTVPGERGPRGDDETPRKRLETSRFQDVPVRVELMVRFEVLPNNEAKGRAPDR
jgi:uncharacterized protein YggE